MEAVVLALWAVASLALWWGYAGYLFWLFLAGRHGERASGEAPQEALSMAILVPCYNEAELIERKLANLASLCLPDRAVQMVLMDGGSTDGTWEKASLLAEKRPGLQLLRSPVRGKIPQLNYALGQVEADIIVNTDVDAELSSDVLLRLAEEFQKAPQVGVVGTFVSPGNSSPEEREFWRTQNRMRLWESGIGCAASVVAACYAFRRKIVPCFSGDVIADDVYVCFQAQLAGLATRYIPQAMVWEERAAQTLAQFARHKFRKANANLRELFRFLPRVGRMHPLWRLVFLSKFLQTAILPLAWVAFVGLLGLLLFWQAYLAAGLSLVLLLASAVASQMLLARLPGRDGGSASLWLNLKTLLVTNVILLAALVSFPFFHRTSSYTRLGSATASERMSSNKRGADEGSPL